MTSLRAYNDAPAQSPYAAMWRIMVRLARISANCTHMSISIVYCTGLHYSPMARLPRASSIVSTFPDVLYAAFEGDFRV